MHQNFFPVPNYVDPEELPFTTDELFRAACRFLPPESAREAAEHLTTCGPGLVAARTKRREGWRAAGLRNADHMPLHGWVYPEELLPALAALSPELAQRVRALEQFLQRDWSQPA